MAGQACCFRVLISCPPSPHPAQHRRRCCGLSRLPPCSSLLPCRDTALGVPTDERRSYEPATRSRSSTEACRCPQATSCASTPSIGGTRVCWHCSATPCKWLPTRTTYESVCLGLGALVRVRGGRGRETGRQADRQTDRRAGRTGRLGGGTDLGMSRTRGVTSEVSAYRRHEGMLAEKCTHQAPFFACCQTALLMTFFIFLYKRPKASNGGGGREAATQQELPHQTLVLIGVRLGYLFPAFPCTSALPTRLRRGPLLVHVVHCSGGFRSTT